MLWTNVALATAGALLGAKEADAFIFWWPFSEPQISPFAFSGCIKRTSTWTSYFSSSAPTAAQCVANCASRRSMAYWRASNGLCKCGSSPVASGIFDFSFNPYVAGNEGECGSNYESYVMTPYGFLGCANEVDVSNQVSSSSGSLLINPFKSCDPTNQLMVFKYGTPKRTKWSASCFSPEKPPNVADYDPVQCNGGTYYLYGPTPPEGVHDVAARRSAALSIDEDILAHPWCPAGHTPCKVDADESLGYECVDIDSESAQCGGCALGEYGLNVGNATGVDCGDKASCAAGKCIPFAH